MATIVKAIILLCCCQGALAAYWEVQGPYSGLCDVNPDTGCLATIDVGGGDYSGGETCTVQVTDSDWDGKCMSVGTFDVDSGDVFTVNGNAYSGSSGPDGVRPSGTITFTSQASDKTGAGFSICPSTSGCESDDTVTIVVVIVCVVVVLCGCALAAFFVVRKRGAAGDSSSGSDSDESLLEGLAPTKPAGSYFVRPRVRTGEVPAADAAAPVYWKTKNLTSFFNDLVDCDREMVEAVERMMRSTFKPIPTQDRKGAKMPKGLKVIKVKRNENIGLWKKYAAGRNGVRLQHSHRCVSMDSAYGGKVVTQAHLPDSVSKELRPRVNECFLWHGTNPERALSICRSGFDLRRAGSNAGSMYGPGTYFAECSSKSDEYANSADAGIYQGMCCLLLCRVVLGEVHMLTNAGEAVHAVVKASMECGSYDSVLGNRQAAVGTYREFVVYQEDQIYPEYVVIYERDY